MCGICNPICGACKPPRKQPVKCPECGTYNVYDLAPDMGTVACKKCGVDLTSQATPKPLACNYCGDICYNPCSKGKEKAPLEGLQECRFWVAKPFTTDASSTA